MLVYIKRTHTGYEVANTGKVGSFACMTQSWEEKQQQQQKEGRKDPVRQAAENLLKVDFKQLLANMEPVQIETRKVKSASVGLERLFLLTQDRAIETGHSCSDGGNVVLFVNFFPAIWCQNAFLHGSILTLDLTATDKYCSSVEGAKKGKFLFVVSCYNCCKYGQSKAHAIISSLAFSSFQNVFLAHASLDREARPG